MGLDATAKRRWTGALALLGALAMLVLGITALKERLDAMSFLVYWLVCLALTVVAIFTAFADLKAVQQTTRDEHRELLESTLRKIERDAREKRKR